MRMEKESGRFVLHVVLSAWLGLLVVGGVLLWRHVAVAGDSGAPPPLRPAAFAPADGKPLLVLFLHPRCPCSRATISELIGLLERSGGRLAVHAFVYRPADGGAEWDEDGVREALAGIPSVTTDSDANGEVARRFGALTSGQAYLYAADGRLLFSGGLTGGRGHVGPNAGASAVAALLDSAVTAGVVSTPVFGCVIAGGS